MHESGLPVDEHLLDPLLSWLEASLLDDERVSLTEVAGDGRSASLHEIFADLPLQGATTGHEGREAATISALQTLSSRPSDREETTVLILGGPGQGKSTITRALAQRARAELLRERSRTYARTAADVTKVVAGYRALDAHCRVVDAPRWLPVRIDLARFAEYLPTDTETTGDELVLRWLHQRGSKLLGPSGATVPYDAMREAVRRWGPVLLLVDGLDEVPASARRADVVRAVRAFAKAFGNGQWRTIVTTRPHGYDGAFDEFAAYTLVPLDDPTTDAIVGRAFATWFQRTSDERETIERALAQIRADESTRALVGSPLFVAILLVALEVEPAVDGQRWVLLETFFDTILKREQRKLGPDAADIKRFSEHISIAHRRVALLLHAEAEGGERTDSALAVERFTAVVREIFRQRGEREPTLTRNVETVVRLARERLVLLVVRSGSGALSFDVRLFQEFFAAWALVVERGVEPGSRSLTRSIPLSDRFAQIALVSHWVQVVLLAASATTSRWPEHRESLTIGLLERLAASDVHPLHRVIELALLMIRERVDREHPDLSEQLARFALRVLEIAPTGVHLEVVSAFEARGWCAPSERVFELARSATTEVIDKGVDPIVVRSAWIVLQALAASGPDESALERDIDERWPTDEGDHDALVKALLSEIAGWFWRVGLGGTRRWTSGRSGVPRLSNGTCRRLQREAGERCLVEQLLWRAFDSPRLFQGFVTLNEWVKSAPLATARIGAEDIQIFGRRLADSRGIERVLDCIRTTPSERAMLEFWLRPSLDGLVSIVELMAVDVSNSRRWPWLFGPWPVAMMFHALRVHSVRDLAGLIHAGVYGDPMQWRDWEGAAEDALTRRRPVNVAELEQWLDSEHAVTAAPVVNVAMADVSSSVSTSLPLVRFAAEASRKGGSPQRIMRCMDLWAWNLPGETQPASWSASLLVEPALLLAWSKTHPLESISVDALCSIIAQTDLDRWLDVFESIPLDQLAFGWGDTDPQHLARRTAALGNVADRLRSHSRASALLEFAAVLTMSLRRSSPTFEPPPWMPRPAEFEPGVARCCAYTIFAARREALDDVGKFVDCLVESLPDVASNGHWKYWPITASARVVANGPIEDARADAYIQMLLAREELRDPDLHSELLAILGERAERRRGNLAHSHRWSALDLPQPAPLPPPMTMFFDQSTVRISALEVHDLRSLGDVRVDVLHKGDPREGSWIVLIGPNGAGKTTLLRAFALALDPVTSRGMLDHKPPSFRAAGRDRARVSVGVSMTDPRNGQRSRSFDAVVVGRADAPAVETVEASAHEEHERPWVVGYGARRGSAVGEDDRNASFSPAESLESLFDRPFTLVNAEAWLHRQRSAMLEELTARSADEGDGPAKRRYDHIVACVRAILPGQPELEFINGVPCFTGAEIGTKVRLAALSDGYVTTLGWIVDLMARWVERWGERHPDHPLPESFTSVMTGVVLLDEIDLHLHPLWQIQIIEQVRKIFPKLSFVTTTHNPLTILNAREGEVFAVRRESDGMVRIQQRDVPRGLAVDQILTGPWFGMSATLDSDTQRLLDRHWELRYVEKVDVDHEERRSIEAQLSQRLGPAGAMWVDRMRGLDDDGTLDADARAVLDEAERDRG